MEPVLVVLASSAGAVAIAAAGILPVLGRERVPRAWLGWANAAAAGAMLGAAYVLAERGIAGQPLALGFGALLGIGFVWWTHDVSGTGDLERNLQGPAPATYASDVLLVGALHSAAEGLAVGAAMAVDLRLGIWIVATIALHNVPESTILAAVFRSRGVGNARALLLTLVGAAPIVPMAVSAFAVVDAAPVVAPWALGFGSGTLIYLVTVDLLPESYRQAGATSIALVALLAMGIVAAVREIVQ